MIRSLGRGAPARRIAAATLAGRYHSPAAVAMLEILGEVAERFELHPNVARHHLEKLAAGGYLDVELARHESAGRPSKRYRASAHDTNLAFPPRPIPSTRARSA
ncbi:MAG TPA: hypothetical protein VFL30_05420 [Rhodanobacteraceae bacterium]|nr:hypothetical protein [Rhodanobacteraceae bacterium]